jgi:hypothetical protein
VRKTLGVVGRPRKSGNTHTLVSKMLWETPQKEVAKDIILPNGARAHVGDP